MIRIVEQYDVRTLRIEEGFKMLLLHQPEVQLLAKEYGTDPMTKRLKEAHIHRL